MTEQQENITISNCLIYGQTHIYNLKITRSLVMMSFPKKTPPKFWEKHHHWN